MSIKKILAAAAASVLTVGAMSVAASAAALNLTVKGQPDMTLDSNSVGKPEGGDFSWAADDFIGDIDVSEIVKIEADITVDSGYCNGAIGGNVDGSWDAYNYVVESADKTTVSWTLDGELDETFQIQVWWINPIYDEDGELAGNGTLTISDVRLLDANGNDLAAAAANPAPTETPTTTPDDTSKPNTDTGVEGVAAVVGVAVVAAGAMVVAKKRK